MCAAAAAASASSGRSRNSSAAYNVPMSDGVYQFSTIQYNIARNKMRLD